MKNKGKSENADDSKALCHENIYIRDCQTGPLKRDRSELCPQCPFRDLFDHELEKGYKFYSEQKALLSAERFEQFLNEETIKPTECMRKAVIGADDPGEGRTTNWGNCNGLYIGNKEILQQLKEFREADKKDIRSEEKQLPKFTERELEVIRIIQSMTYPEIASALSITESAVKQRIKTIKQKTGVKNKAELKRFVKDNF